MKIQLPDVNTEIEPMPATGGGYTPEPGLDRLSNILKTFNVQFGNIPWGDADRVHNLITEGIPSRVAADKGVSERTRAVGQAERAHRARQGARARHDCGAEGRHAAVQAVHGQRGFRRWLTDTVFGLTYSEPRPM